MHARYASMHGGFVRGGVKTRGVSGFGIAFLEWAQVGGVFFQGRFDRGAFEVCMSVMKGGEGGLYVVCCCQFMWMERVGALEGRGCMYVCMYTLLLWGSS